MSLEAVLESLNWFTLTLAVSLCLVFYAYAQWSRSPQGPMGLPYVGYYPFLTEGNSHHQLLKLSKKYGDVFCFKVTGQLYAHITGLKNIREVAVTKSSECFEKRSSVFTVFMDVFGEGVFMQNGEHWKAMRKFFLQQFKEIGMGKKAQEGIMQDSLKKIISRLKKTDGMKFDALTFFAELSNDVISQMIFGGVKLDEDDVREFNSAYRTATEFILGDRLLLAGPLLKYVLIPFHPQYCTYRKNLSKIRSIIKKFIRQQERDFDRNNIRNLIDSYINERKSLEEKKDPKAKYFTEGSLQSSILQFYGDGTLGIGWLSAAILHAIALRPDIQKRIQSEVDEVVGPNRFPSSDDKSRLPYTNAVIYEGLRTTEFIPLLPHNECTKETILGGCRIPKGTIALFNTWSVFHDPKLYEEPDKFDPSRFLSVDGKKPKSDPPIIFGVGKRSCIGESLAMMEMLLFITTVMQNFDLHPAGKQASLTEWSIDFRATPRVLKN